MNKLTVPVIDENYEAVPIALRNPVKTGAYIAVGFVLTNFVLSVAFTLVAMGITTLGSYLLN